MKRLLLTWLVLFFVLATPPLAGQSFAVPCKTITATRAAVGKDSVQVQVTARCKLLRDTVTVTVTKTDTLRLPGRTDTLYLPAPKDSVVVPPKDTVVVPPKDTVVTPPPPPTGTGYRAHEPAGYSTITDNALASRTYDGWYVESGNPTLGSDATAPVSGPSVMVANQGGVSSGSAPWALQRVLGKGYNSIYLSLTFKLSANFQGEPSGTNKLLFVSTETTPTFFLSTEGAGSGTLTPTVRVQGGVNDYARQLAGASVSRGVWHTWEAVITRSTKTITWWFDGKLQGSVSDAPFYGTSFTTATLYAIWGGYKPGLTAPSGQAVTFDHFYLSGK